MNDKKSLIEKLRSFKVEGEGSKEPQLNIIKGDLGQWDRFVGSYEYVTTVNGIISFGMQINGHITINKEE